MTSAFVASVMCNAPPESVHASQVSTVPKHRSRCRSGSNWSSSCSTFVPERFGATFSPPARSSRQRPTVRRSCQPRPGPTGSPVARSQTIVVPRWLASPTATTGPVSSSAACESSSAAAASSAASSSTSPGKGVEGSVARRCSVTTRATDPARSTTTARVDDVPTSITRTRAVPRRARGGHGQAGDGPNGLSSPSLPGLRIPCGSRAALAAASTPNASPSASRANRARLSPTP